ncbi:MAG TPA: GxxExxY protein [Phycisphaerales bacterium]|nr:GxxExxY protein [Phycisphaerales bacterium]
MHQTRGQLVAKRDLPIEVERLSHTVIGLAIDVHTTLGPGLLERVYEDALCVELRRASVAFKRQSEVPVIYKGESLTPHVLDLTVGDCLVIECKAVKQLHEVHTAQVLSYLKVTDRPLGLLFNFHSMRLREDMKRILNSRWSGFSSSISSISSL